HRTVRSLQPDAVIFSDAGPDVRWIGNERGVAGETCWSTIDPAAVPYPGYSAPGVSELLQRGDPHGSVWRPGETDVSIRPGWFWHPEEEDRVRTVENLVDLHFTSVGRNSKLLLNVPPTREGRLGPVDVARPEGVGQAVRAMYAPDLLADSRGSGSAAARLVDGEPGTWWSPPGPDGRTGSVELALPAAARCSVVCLEEAIAHGQVVEGYRVDARVSGVWRAVARGTTIGHRKLDRIAPVTTDRIRLTIDRALGVPRIARLSLHLVA